jgi:hypothetical protein
VAVATPDDPEQPQARFALAARTKSRHSETVSAFALSRYAATSVLKAGGGACQL